MESEKDILDAAFRYMKNQLVCNTGSKGHKGAIEKGFSPGLPIETVSTVGRGIPFWQAAKLYRGQPTEVY